MSSPAMKIIQAQIEAGKSRQVIALEIGYSRPAVSRYTSGTYGAEVDDIEAAIMARYDRRECPHLGKPVEPETCIRKALTPRPFGGQARERHWEACQTCQYKPSAKQPSAISSQPSAKPAQLKADR